jgi:hypothetical protein
MGATLTVSGTVYNWPTNVSRINEFGTLIEQTQTNLLSQSQALGTAPWTTVGIVAAAPTVTNNSTDLFAPDGTTTATKIVYPTVGATGISLVNQPVNVLASTNYVMSAYMCTLSGAATGSIFLINGGSLTNYGSPAFNLTNKWQRFSFTSTLGAGDGGAGNHGIGFLPSQLGTGEENPIPNFTVYVWGAQLEKLANSSQLATSYIPTAANSLSRGTELVSVTNPLSSSGILPWGIRVDIQPQSGSAWNDPALTRGIIFMSPSFSGSFTTSNSFAFFALAASSKFELDVYDTGGASTQSTTWLHSFATGSKHSLALTSNSGSWNLYADGQWMSGTITSAGTGQIAALPSTIAIGPWDTGGAQPLQGYYSNLVVAQTIDPGVLFS